ncbi:hypothetical protein AAF712_009468 [Marasmius tenuissimus]|uniref:F-box domain-containing protein n=1 Tax=Marasmius tenuissimus TaxID=585030 RepID=A0ABR2ZPV3_9AGAR
MTTQPQPQSDLASFEDCPGKTSLSQAHELCRPLENHQASENSPIDHIPNEIWSSIFYEHTRSFGRSHNLVQVCTRWHDLAINEPRQWTSIEIDVGKIKQHRTAEQVSQALSIQLSRSNDLPLNICFSDPEFLPITLNEHDLPNTSSTTLFNTLLEHRNRWKSLNLTLHISGGAINVLRESGPFHLPSLENLSARFLTNEKQKQRWYKLYQIIFLHRLINLNDPPSLTTLRLSVLPPTSGVMERSLESASFVHLAHIIIEACGVSSLYNWLEYTKSGLRFCDVERALVPEIPLPPSTTVLRLDKLEALTIPQAHTSMLDFLVLPELKALVIRPDPDPDTSEQSFDISIMMGLIARSGCHLDVLEFYAPVSGELGDIHKSFPEWLLGSEEMMVLKKVILSKSMRQ